MKKREYSDYSEYIQHQKTKTIKSCVKSRFLSQHNSRKKIFKANCEIIKNRYKSIGKVLCLGARFGEEVEAWIELGYEAIGIDLVAYPPFVIEGDFNNLPYDNEFDIIYTNSLDYSIDTVSFQNSVYKALKSEGIFFVEVSIKNFSDYEVICFDDPEEVIKAFDKFTILDHFRAKCSLYRGQKVVDFVFKK